MLAGLSAAGEGLLIGPVAAALFLWKKPEAERGEA